MAFMLASPAFNEGQTLPRRYARDGDNVSPPLNWTDPPAETRSFALIVEDPDAPSGTFRHWAVYNIPPAQHELPGTEDKDPKRWGLGVAVNDFGNAGYDGPQPPPGHGRHYYHFKLAALDVPKLDLPANAKAEQVWRAAQGHVLATTELVATFEAR